MKTYIIGAAAAFGILTAGFAVNRAYADESPDDKKILDNIYIGDVSVGGMSAEEAEQAVEDYVSGIQDTKFTLSVNKKSITATAGQLGVEWENTGVVEEAAAIGKSGSLIARYKDKKDLEHKPKVLSLSFQAEQSKIEEYLEKNEKKISQKAVDGGLIRENGAFTITDGKEGITVNVSESAQKIAEYIADSWDTKEASIELTAKVVQPRGSKEQLAKVKDVLGTFSTDYSSSAAGRAQNVANGCSRINGTVLYPGDQFSVYEAVSPFDAENGYALAGSYENGSVVQTYGGGICQVSTTLYNAVIRAELEIKERFAHSMIVTYVQPSMDAAIAGTYKDLKFVNNTEAPIYIEGAAGGGTLTFTVYGEETRDENREVVFESEIVSETNPPTQIRGSASYNVGYVGVQQSSHQGKVAKLWKVVKVNGEEKSREEFNNSTYSASPRIITVGTNTSSAEARAYIQSAIASQNEANIYAAAKQAAAIAANPPAPQEPEDPEEPGEESPEEPNEGSGDKKTDSDKKDDKDNSDKKTDTKKDTEKKDTDKKGTEKKDTKSETKKDTAQDTAKTDKNAAKKQEAAIDQLSSNAEKADEQKD